MTAVNEMIVRNEAINDLTKMQRYCRSNCSCSCSRNDPLSLPSMRNRIRQVLLDLHELLELRRQISGILIIRLGSLLRLLCLWRRRKISAVLRIVLWSSGRRIVLSASRRIILLCSSGWRILGWSYGNLVVVWLLRCLADLYLRPISRQFSLIYVLRLDGLAGRQIRYLLRRKMNDRIASLLRGQYLLDRRRRLIVALVIRLLPPFSDVA